MTYRLQMAGAARRMEREQQNAMAVAWHTGSLARVKTFPSFSVFTGIKTQVRKQTPEEVKAYFRGQREAAVPA